MSNYEFWDDLGRIFNLVAAYQEKSIEFNKRFINPWIRLGNVFDRQDRTREAIEAYKKAIEIDPANAQSWCDLGSAYFKAEDYSPAVDAFRKAIELNPRLGWAHSNLALTLVSQDDHSEAVSLYQKSIELLDDPKDKAVSWNRLGNLYRKLNEYDQAVAAFQKADQLDHENAGFRDALDEVPQAQDISGASTAPDGGTLEIPPSPIELIVEESLAEEAALSAMAAPEVEEDLSGEADDQSSGPVASGSLEEGDVLETNSEPAAEAAPAQAVDEIAVILDELTAEAEAPASAGVDEVAEPASEDTEAAQAVSSDIEAAAEPQAEASPAAVDEAAQASVEAVETESPAVAEPKAETPAAEESVVAAEPEAAPVETVVETYTQAPVVTNTSTETTGLFLVEEAVAAEMEVPAQAASPAAEAEQVVEVSAAEQAVEASPEPEVAAEPPSPVAEAQEVIDEPAAEQPVEASPELEALIEPAAEQPAPEGETVEAAALEAPALDETTGTASEEPVPAPASTPEVAYEEFLKDDGEALTSLAAAPEPEPQESSIPAEPLKKIDASGEFQIQMDTKNAHVWNELGNVYFNNGAVDDSIVAYSKAIELDRWFAWPYSNLALAYVQKGRFAEAVLLYQRSIELFTSEKDKAVSWNRLGNVYRRMSDYDNAIAAYQRADDLDPDNTALSLQSRFSLLGSFQMEQSPSYAAA